MGLDDEKKLTGGTIDSSSEFDYLAEYDIEQKPKNFDYTDFKGKRDNYEYFDLVPGEDKGFPVIYATGFASNGAMIPGIMGSFPEIAKRRLLVPNEVMGVPYLEYLKNKGISEDIIHKYEPEHLKKVVALLQVLDKENIEKVDIFAHSEGSIHALIASNLFPNRFNKIVINSSVGLTKEKSAVKLVVNTIKEIVTSKVDNILSGPESYKPKNNKVLGELKEKNFKVLGMLWKSLLLMPKTNIKPYIEKAIYEGIDVKLVHSEFDMGFPLEQVKKRLGKKLQHILTVVKNANHNTIIRQPGAFTENVINKHFIQDTQDDVDDILKHGEIDLIKNNKAPESLKNQGGGPIFVFDGGGPGGGAVMAGQLYNYLENGGKLPKAIIGSSVGSVMALYLKYKTKDLKALKIGATVEEAKKYDSELRKLLMEGLKDLFDGNYKTDLKTTGKASGILKKLQNNYAKESSFSQFFTHSLLGRGKDIFNGENLKSKHFDVGIAISHSDDYKVGDTFNDNNESYIIYNESINGDVLDASTAHKGTLGKQIEGKNFNDGDYGDYIKTLSKDSKKQDVIFFTSYEDKYPYSFEELEKKSKTFKKVLPNNIDKILQGDDRFDYSKLKNIFYKSINK